ncbi:MAG: preprotein translocase subunit SecY [Firmicutes bacterium]|nr:preprotein translocase subunit SecY [Bacillota bacterium]
MIEQVADAVKISELKNRVLYLLFAFAIFVFATRLSVPGINLKVWQNLLSKGAIFSFIGLLTGGALNHFAVVAMGITPYINASIMMQLLTIIIPQWEELQKEGGEMGRKQIALYTRLLTIVLSIFEASMMTYTAWRYGAFSHPTIWSFAATVLVLTAGTAFLLWLGEMMTDKGIGNGISLLIFAGIVLQFPYYVSATWGITSKFLHSEGAYVLLKLLAFIAVTVILIALIVAFTLGIRKVPVQYAKRVVGRRVMGGQSTYIPVKVDNGGVIAIIFAISLLFFPMTVLNFLSKSAKQSAFVLWLQNHLSPQSWVFNLIYALLVIGFTYFYAYITFNIKDVTDNLKKYGGFIPGIRPGKPTSDALTRILNRVTFIAALFLALIAVAPGWFTYLFHVYFYLGSTSLLIIVGVVLDTIQQFEARMLMRHYKGFLK